MAQEHDAGHRLEPPDDLFVEPERLDQGAELVRAIEAILLVATEPVPPDLLAQLLEIPASRVEERA